MLARASLHVKEKKGYENYNSYPFFEVIKVSQEAGK